MNSTSQESAGLASLTPRELEVLHWVAEGKMNGDIGLIIGCKETTVKKHLERVFAKLGVETRTAAAVVYLREGAPWRTR